MRTISIAIAAMLIGGTAYAGDVIAPPISKYVEAPLPPKRPTNFGKLDNQKVAQKVQEVTNRH
jgi:hypothetical protein